MPLQPQNVDVPFEGGLDTNLDRKKVIPGKLLDLENATFDGKSLNLRPGTSYLEDEETMGDIVPDALALATRGTELLRWSTRGVYGQAMATLPQAWNRRAGAAEAAPLTYQLLPLAARALSCESYTAVSVGGVVVTAWTERGQNGRELRASVQDEVTGTRYQDATLLATDTNGFEPWRLQARLVVAGDIAVLVYGVSGPAGAAVSAPVYARALYPTLPTAFQPAVFLFYASQRPARTNPYELDAVSLPNGFATALSRDDGVLVQIYKVSPVISSTGNAVAVPASGGGLSYRSTSLFSNADGSRLYTTYTNPNNGFLELHTFTTTDPFPVPLVHLSTGNLGTVGNTNSARVTAYEEATGVMRAVVDIINNPFQLLAARWNASTGVVTEVFNTALTAAVAWGVSLAGRAARVGGRWVLPVSSPLRTLGTETPGIQPTWFLLDALTGRVLVRALEGACGTPLASTWLVPPVLAAGVDAASFLVPKRIHVEFDIRTGVLVDTTSVGLVRLDASPIPPAQAQRLEEGNTLHVGGAAPALYDGGSWTEDGFNLRPQMVTAASPPPMPLPSGTFYLGDPPGGPGATGLSAGTYSWAACYEWVDAQGRVHQSAPSVPASLTVSSGASVYLTAPVLGLTAKQRVRIVVYRTLADGTVFYRVGTSLQSFIQPTPQDRDVQGFIDLQTDDNISDGAVLAYTGPTGGTSGGELWHHPPPAYTVAVRHDDYLFVLPLDEPNNVAYSLPLEEDAGPAWADELRVRVPTTYGLAVALATLDDKLLVLCERGAWAVVGQGPTRDGRNNGFQKPVYVTGSVGCLSAASVLSSTEGVYYQAPQGYFCLTRGLETVPAGEDVQRYAALPVSRALEVPARRELRWYTTEGTTLLYSQRWQQWAVWTGQTATDAARLGEVVHFADGLRVRYEDPTSNFEGSTQLEATMGTAWVKPSGFQGLERVWKALVLGKSTGDFHLTCAVFYDNREDAPGQVYEKDFTATDAQAWRVRLTLGKQLCNTLRFRWKVRAVLGGPALAPAPGRCDISLSALTLECGVHPRPSKRGVQNFGSGGT